MAKTKDPTLEIVQICNLCGQECRDRGTYRVLGKYDAKLEQCTSCQFCFAVQPQWLEEAYSSPMTKVDLGPVFRGLHYAQIAKIVLELLLDPRGRGLDFGGGFGIFTRRMRDLGYNFFWQDKHCPNLFAQGFEGELGNRFELVTAFEVLEHIVDPKALIDQILDSSRAFLFTTLLLPDPFPRFDQWWYFGPEHGQHVSFYTRKTLATLAKQAGRHFITNGVDLHLIGPKRSERLFRFMTSARVSHVFDLLRSRESLLLSDFDAGRRAILESAEDKERR